MGAFDAWDEMHWRGGGGGLAIVSPTLGISSGRFATFQIEGMPPSEVVIGTGGGVRLVWRYTRHRVGSSVVSHWDLPVP